MTVTEIWQPNCPQADAVLQPGFMHCPVAGNCSQSTGFRASSQDSASFQKLFYFGDIMCSSPPPPPTRLIMQHHTTYCRIISKGRCMKHVYANIDILHSEVRSILKVSLKKYYNVLWYLSVATVGMYWRLLWSTTVCHI
jgi:hypothetical protein